MIITIKIITIAQVIIQLMLALQTLGSPVELLSKLPEDPIDPPNGDNDDDGCIDDDSNGNDDDGDSY